MHRTERDITACPPLARAGGAAMRASRPRQLRGKSAARAASPLAALGIAAHFLLSAGLPACAQQASDLRGDVGSDDPTASISSYQPVSQGALPDLATPPGVDDSDQASTAMTVLAPDSVTIGDASQPHLPTRSVPKPAPKKTPLGSRAATGSASNGGLDNLRIQSIAPSPTLPGRAESGNQRETAAGARQAKPDDDPYAPPGLRMGSFILRPTLEQGLRGTTNADFTATGRSALLSETAVSLEATSDWSRHRATLKANGTFDRSITGQNVAEPQFSISGDLRLDLAGGMTATAGAAYDLQKESANTPNSVAGTLSQPLVHTIDANLGIERNSGLLYAKIGGKFERQIYGDAQLSGGGTLSQSDRNNNYAGLTLRGGVNISAALRPFIEAEAGRLLYDERFDTGGYQRSADRFALRGGLAVDMGEKLSGELSAGYVTERFDDPRLADLASPTVAASLEWSPKRGTKVTTNLSTVLEDSTTAGESGDVLYSSSLTVLHSVRANLDLTATIGAWLRDLKGTGGQDYGASAEAGFVYWFNRFVGVDTSARYEVADSDDPSRRARAASIFVGLKLRR